MLISSSREHEWWRIGAFVCKIRTTTSASHTSMGKAVNFINVGGGGQIIHWLSILSEFERCAKICGIYMGVVSDKYFSWLTFQTDQFHLSRSDRHFFSDLLTNHHRPIVKLKLCCFGGCLTLITSSVISIGYVPWNLFVISVLGKSNICIQLCFVNVVAGGMVLVWIAP